MRTLHDHPSTKAEPLDSFRPVVEGWPFLERSEDGSSKPVTMGADGIAISADGTRLVYCPLASRRWYSVATEALLDRSLSADEVATTVVDEGDKGTVGWARDRRRRPALPHELRARGGHATASRLQHGDRGARPRLLWPDTMSVAADGYLYVTASQLRRQAKYQGGQDLREQPYHLFRVRVDSMTCRSRSLVSASVE